jgi:hypothetical protein
MLSSNIFVLVCFGCVADKLEGHVHGVQAMPLNAKTNLACMFFLFFLIVLTILAFLAIWT